MSGRTKAAQKPPSRVGRRPIPVPQGVEVKMRRDEISVSGPKGSLTQSLHPGVRVKVDDGTIAVSARSDDSAHRALHGLTRSLIANAIDGVSQGFQKTLLLRGVGYRVQQSGKGIVLNVGFSHAVEVEPIEGVTLVVEGNNTIHVQGVDKQRVGEMAARIRRVRPPNPYKDKGIRYSDETLRFKPGKAAARSV